MPSSSFNPTESAVPIPSAVWHAVAAHFGDALHALRLEATFEDLSAGEWAVLSSILHPLSTGAASPQQRDLERQTGHCIRVIREHLITLKRLDVLHGGGRGADFEVGPPLARFLCDFARSRTAAPWHHGPAPAAGHENGPAAPWASRTALPTSEKAAFVVEPARAAARLSLIKKNKDLSSSSLEEETTPLEPAAAAGLDDVTARRLATEALAALFRRANPGVSLPRTCSTADVRRVEACAAEGTWSAAEFAQMNQDAIAGAFERSAEGRIPTPSFIWGRFHYFVEHARVGRNARLRSQPPPKPPKRLEPDDPPASFAWVAAHLAAFNASFNAPQPTPPRSSTSSTFSP